MSTATASVAGVTDIDKVEQEMVVVIDNLEKSISRLKGKVNDEKRLERCTQLLKKLAGLLESLKLDVTAMEESHPDKKKWVTRANELQTRSEELKVQFNERRREVEKKVFLKSNPQQAEKIKNLSGDEDVSQLDKMQALAVGDVLLDKAEKSLARTKKLVVESEQMGVGTLEKMEAQNDQMERIYEDFDDIDNNIARSKRIIGHIAQSAVNDRCIQILTLFVFIALVVVIVQQFTGSSSESSRLRRLLKLAASPNLQGFSADSFLSSLHNLI